MPIQKIITELQNLPKYFSEGRYHIYTKHILALAKKVGRNQKMAEELWQRDDILGAKHLAIRIAEPKVMTLADLDRWVQSITNWETCDAFCGHVVRETPFAVEKIYKWAKDEREFVRRAAFSTIAQLAWIKSEVPDKTFLEFLPLIEKYSFDDRYFVKKAVNWALRDIGKRNTNLAKEALALSQKLQQSSNKTQNWVGKHKMKEVCSG